MNRELTRRDPLLFAGVFDELSGQTGRLAVRDHPAGDVAAEDIEDDVQIVKTPLHRTSEFGDVPAPKLVRAGGQQFRLPVGRMDKLVAAFAVFAACIQKPVHGANRAVIPAIVKQRSINLRRRTVLKALLMKASQNDRLLVVLQAAR